MVDIHSHVLPGVDDGPQTMEDSMKMLRLAADTGTTDIVATPHANAQFTFDEARVNFLFRELMQLSSGIIRLHLGCDFHLNYENLVEAIQNPQKFTINRGRYLMLELPDSISPSAIQTGIRQLQDANIVPIITHPERNTSIQDNFREMEAWRKQGCLLQITGQSLLGRFGAAAQKSAEHLLKAHMVDFVASDAHDCTDRTPDLSSAYAFVRSRYGTGAANHIFIENPVSVLRGEPIYKKKRKSKWKSWFT